MRIVVLWALAALVATQLGCASANADFAAPRIAVQNIAALPPTAGQQRFRVSVIIDNPNPEPLVIRYFEFQLRLADQGILDGREAVPFTVAALERHTLVLELRSDIISSASRLLSFAEGPDNALPYELFGRLTLDRALREPLPVSASGQVPLSMSGDN